MVVVVFFAGVVVGQIDNLCQGDAQVKMRMAP
jgi:hypothetical protein